jgi:membrane peptidoglycan carboxypeptidase
MPRRFAPPDRGGPRAGERPTGGSTVAGSAGGLRRLLVWRRVGRWLLRACLGLIALTAVLSLVATVYVVTLPGVGDAQARVRRVLALHHGTYAPLPVPGRLGDGVVAVEDEHFYSNFVVEILDGAGRAALATLRTSRDPGGSTIPQQLAKQIYGDGSSLRATLQEIGLGVKLSLTYSKAEILNMYLNVVYYGHGFWGDVAAARGYFGTSPRRLDWAEAAMLAGLPQAPSAYDPLEHLARAKRRQRHVLDQLVSNHFLTPAQADRAFRAPLPLR